LRARVAQIGNVEVKVDLSGFQLVYREWRGAGLDGPQRGETR